MTTTIHADQIDLREITDRVEELRNDRAAYVEENENALDPIGAWNELNPEDYEELADLEKLLDETRGNGGDHQWDGDWYPGSLIAEDYFETAMDDMIDDCYGDQYTKNLPSFMKLTIDYDALRMDYTEVEFDGVTYLYR